MLSDDEFSEIIISGAGPAGITTSLFLSLKKIKHTLIEKEQFPRDKICGDALSGKVLNILKKLDNSFVNELYNNNEIYNPSKGIIFVSPDFTKVEIPFKLNYISSDEAPGFVAKRLNFDNFLFNKINQNYCHVYQNCTLTNVEKTNSGILADIKHNGISFKKKCKVIVACDGANSIISRKLANYKIDHHHYSAGIRAYFSNVKNLNPEGYIELIYLKEYLPGYFWIFPLPNGNANVGVGMLSQNVIEKKIDLKKMFENTLKFNPKIAPRFESAIQQTSFQGWGLPLASKKMKISGNNFLLCGDAASLIDPFTGEGVASAMLSGKLAAETIEEAMEKDDFSATILRKYDLKYFKTTQAETRISTILQKLIRNEKLFNFVLKRISKNNELKNVLTLMFADVNLRKKFLNPLFYFKLFFKN
ncbi:MAG: geranylgeranyl reductase family protein [Bacteroidetes bacterium]|nr:geranylgeranyl reductase family protein [Bacteroidota bacterium]